MAAIDFHQIPVDDEGKQRFQTLIGPLVTKWLKNNPDEIVVSGSVVLDYLDGTSFASDIDVFCTRRVAKTIVLQDGLALGVRRYFHRTYSENSYDRFAMVAPISGKQIDIVVCESPLATVSRFDMSHNKVAFDGKTLYKHAVCAGGMRTSANIDYSVVDTFNYCIMRDLPNREDPTYESRYDELKQTLDLAVNPIPSSPLATVFMGMAGDVPVSKPVGNRVYANYFRLRYNIPLLKRIAKYKSRGYEVLDKNHWCMNMSDTVVSLLCEVSDRKEESRVIEFDEANEMYFGPDHLPDIETLKI